MKVKLLPPRFPNFLRFEGQAEMSISIGAISDEDLEEYAEKWKQGLIKHAKCRRDAYSVKTQN